MSTAVILIIVLSIVAVLALLLGLVYVFVIKGENNEVDSKSDKSGNSDT
jgi:hypothetical protein